MLAIACSHASGAPAGRRPSSNGPSPRTSSSDVSAAAAQLSEETHALLRAEGELLWTRWTTWSGPLPASARDTAVDKAIAALGLQSWAAVEERAHGIPIADLAQLAESTLDATEQVGGRAVSTASVRNLGVTADRLRRADLPRLARTALADPQFTPGKAWPPVRAALPLVGT